MAASGSSMIGRRGRVGALVLGIAAAPVVWTLVDAYYPMASLTVTTAATVAHSTMPTVVGPAAIEIGSLVVNVPAGNTITMRYPETQEPWARWRPKTRQWAHMIMGPTRAQLGDVAKAPLHLIATEFTLRARGDALSKSTACAVRRQLKNGAVLRNKIDSAYPMYADFQSIEYGPYLVPRQTRTFLGGEVALFRMAMLAESLPGEAVVSFEVALSDDVTMRLSMRDANIDGAAFWTALARIEAALAPMLRRTDGRPLKPMTDVEKNCERHDGSSSKP
jgi:hypothetical protein